MPLTVPAWINAVATVIVAFGVVTAVYYVRKAFGTKQRELVAQLTDATRLHASALRLSVDERRRAQACHVFIDLDRSTPLKQIPAAPNAPEAASTPWRITATVHNASSQPVYDLYVIWQLGTERLGRPDPTTKLMPGQQVCFERGSHSADPSATTIDPNSLTAFLTFRDAAGVRWTAREDGTLTDITPASAEPSAAEG
ncbi:MAG TPA: hypothetical protein VN767_03220 [Streptosporangiaceae bacterium]|jgi:hypothetical protein|nr:hypothetical protein [Streptosporangiaceae bacterium]